MSDNDRLYRPETTHSCGILRKKSLFHMCFVACVNTYKLYTLLLDELVSRNLKICRIVYFKISEEIVTPTYRLLEKWTISSDDIFMAFD